MAPAGPEGVSATFWARLTAEPLGGAVVLDVATGAGRVALALAPLCRRVVGIDRDPDLVAEAARRAAAAGLGNVAFRVADADRVEYADVVGQRPSVVTAHLFLSDALVERAARALPPAGLLAIVGFHADQWRETGIRSRFAYDEAVMRTLLGDSGFDVEHLAVERDVRRFASAADALAATADLEARWGAERRSGWRRFLEAGGRTLTRSHLVVLARRRA